ncbi:hypothetical protein BHM03_00011577 [Ensete ventricosum]|nr:hypothetical protein BHM03_00011577 [Ensete ventricosum]
MDLPQFSFLRHLAPLPHQNPNPSPDPIPIPRAADLPTAISLLTDLTTLAESTLKSVSDFLSLPPSSAAAAGDGFCRCPYDRNHRMPPESLFRHSLVCASAPGARLLDLGFLDDLRYPGSLKSEAELRKENSFVQSLPATDADLCFSLDSQLGDLGSNFFYKDCPAVVTTPEPDVATTFTLPGILSAECANFASDRDGESWVFGEGKIRILPSEYWALRCEVEAWNDFPVSYSYTVLRVMLSLNLVEENELLKGWVISKSPQFGIVIDVAMREHIYLLLKLCLKVIGREARSSLKLFLDNEGLFDPKSLNFECPKLVGSFSWLVSQMSILYGETNSKLFTTGMLKESLVQTGSSLMLTSLGRESIENNGSIVVNDACVDDTRCGSDEYKSYEDMKLENPSIDASRGQVFVSQVAAAVAALHEKSFLEKRIKALRFSQPHSKSQLILEHSRRKKKRIRTSFPRAILACSLSCPRVVLARLPPRRPRPQAILLLREEMERLPARGERSRRPIFPVNHDSQNDAISDLCKLQSSDLDDPDARRNTRHKESLDGDAIQSHRSNVNKDFLKSHSKLKYEQHEHLEDQDKYTHERWKSYGSSSSSFHKSSASSRDRIAHEKEHGAAVPPSSKYDSMNSGYFSRSRDHINQSTLTSKSSRREYDYISRDKSKERDRTFRPHRSKSVTQDTFEDRYNPSDSYDDYHATYSNVSADSTYFSSDKVYNPREDGKYNHEQCSQRRSKDYK